MKNFTLRGGMRFGLDRPLIRNAYKPENPYLEPAPILRPSCNNCGSYSHTDLECAEPLPRLPPGEIWYAAIWRRLDNPSAGEWRGSIFPTLVECENDRKKQLSHPMHAPTYVRTVRVIRTFNQGDIDHPDDVRP